MRRGWSFWNSGAVHRQLGQGLYNGVELELRGRGLRAWGAAHGAKVERKGGACGAYKRGGQSLETARGWSPMGLEVWLPWLLPPQRGGARIRNPPPC